LGAFRACAAGAVLLLAAAQAQGQAADGAPALALEDCRISAGPGFPGIKARCGTLERPLDPSNPDAERLDLKVAVVPALSLEPRPDPFVPIAGGPGQSTVVFYAGYSQAFEQIRRDRDIVLLDQRGTGESARLDCGGDEEILAGRMTVEEIAAGTRECLEELPHDPRYFTTSVAVRDLEALRRALGAPAFNVYGISYGTRVAQHYARRHPDTARSVILDGVVPPQLALGPGIAIEAQEALEAIFARCAESPPCAARFPDIDARFAELAKRLQNGPVEVELQDPVTAETELLPFGHNELAGALRILSYHPNTVALVPLLIDQAAAGNYAPLAAQFVMAARSLADALSIGMHNAVVCTEDAPFFDRTIDRAAIDATYMGTMQIDALQAACSAWPAGVMDDDLASPLDTDTPVLLLSGDADPITPPEFAELAQAQMQVSLHLVGTGQGHGQAARTCMPEIMARFVETASVDDLDEGCLEERQFTMPFFLGFTGPSP
jgi:pimeloyl-ACP methyl ester carboxylesterase